MSVAKLQLLRFHHQFAERSGQIAAGRVALHAPLGQGLQNDLREAGRHLRVDRGGRGGIPAEDLPHVFERFYRGEKSRTRSKDGKGFGLGLSIAFWIVRNHDGRIEVDSKEGQGTTFCVWLPLAE